MDALLTRRSIRKYTGEQISESIVKDLLVAAMSAPSAQNQQPWQFIVINKPELLRELPNCSPYAQMTANAPLVIVVCGDTQLEKSKGFWVQDCSAATENILIAANYLGLGAVWVGLYPREERVNAVRNLLGLPDHVIPLALIPIGYPAETKEPANRYDASKVHYNAWQVLNDHLIKGAQGQT
ncbi:nitroreductase family protein [Desulforamulus ruminis]|uniref:Nitroreductase n=1 Tax=Desulforamulus ruminis (strain ATCC 23193 / DSM 2154 / NCIMB 8452 / DL) TaxID=696281 RepID=F6DQW0_DESRL|nr:nitroreductase family protein [Desulforamulus ruminis]AEG58684.1 nitroreductase [Desulforamulus ruminis DSM 2154]